MNTLCNSYRVISLDVGTKDGNFDRRNIFSNVKFNVYRFMASWSGFIQSKKIRT